MQKRIALLAIYGNPDQPRKTFDDTKLRELAASIRENGLKQPITVRADGTGGFMIVMGERRFRASCILAEQGGPSDILCQVSKVDDCQLAVDAIIENDQRVDVQPLEQARSYQRMIDNHGFTVGTLAIKLGKAVRRVQDRLDLLNLNDDVQFLLAKGHIGSEAAYYIAQLPRQKQPKMLKAIQAGQCTTLAQLKALAAAILEEDSQCSMFGDMKPAATEAEVQTARGFEAKVGQIAALLRAGIDDNVVTAVKHVDPGNAVSIADLLAAMIPDIRRIETALRVSASVQMALAA